MTEPAIQQRIAPTDRQVTACRKLLGEVPALSYDWSSAAGNRFLGYVDELAQEGVPIAWLAGKLDLDPARLYATLARFRNQRAFREGTTNGKG